jgi:hypothetical protein
MGRRVVLGISAWLVGAAAATGGSLLAVSALGEGMTPAASQQLSVNAVNRALASETIERPALAPAPASPPATPAARPPAARPRARSPSLSGAGTVLTSQGGAVLAGCAGARAYLVSWSPGQGFEAASVIRGPAATARVAFTDPQQTVTMVVSCASGMPAATTSVISNWTGDD